MFYSFSRSLSFLLFSSSLSISISKSPSLFIGKETVRVVIVGTAPIKPDLCIPIRTNLKGLYGGCRFGTIGRIVSGRRAVGKDLQPRPLIDLGQNDVASLEPSQGKPFVVPVQRFHCWEDPFGIAHILSSRHNDTEGDPASRWIKVIGIAGRMVDFSQRIDSMECFLAAKVG